MRSKDKAAGKHYDFPNGVKVLDLTKHLLFREASIIKYLSRLGRKPGETRLDDLLKCKKYLDDLIRDAVDDKAREIVENDKAAADRQLEACQDAGAPLSSCSDCPASGSCMIERVAQEASEAVSAANEELGDDQIAYHTSVPEFIDKIGTRAGVKKRIL